MKLSCALSSDYRGNPAIKITKDCPTVTLDVYTQDINQLLSLEGKELILSVKED